MIKHDTCGWVGHSDIRPIDWQRWRLRCVAVIAAAFTFFGVSVASASTFTYTTYGVTNGQVLHSGGKDVLAGQIVLSGPTGTLDVWCVDFYDELHSSGVYNLTTSTALTPTQVSEIGGLIVYGDANINTANVSAATQVAIWRVEYGAAFTFSTSTAVTDLSTALIADLGSSIPLNSNVTFLVPTNNSNQILSMVTPLPSTIVLFGTCLGLAIMLRKRLPGGR